MHPFAPYDNNWEHGLQNHRWIVEHKDDIERMYTLFWKEMTITLMAPVPDAMTIQKFAVFVESVILPDSYCQYSTTSSVRSQ